MSHARYTRKWTVPNSTDRYPRISHGNYRELKEKEKELAKELIKKEKSKKSSDESLPFEKFYATLNR